MGDREIYIKKLTGEVRWKRAHGIIEEELMCHIDDQKETFMKGGCDEETAEKKAVEEMGDPVETGRQYDRVMRPKNNLWLLAVMVGISVMSIAVLGFWGNMEMGTEYYASAFIIAPLCFAAVYFADISLIYKYIYIVTAAYIALIFVLNMNNILELRQLIYLLPVIYAMLLCKEEGKGFKGFAVSAVVLAFAGAAAFLSFGMSGIIAMAVCGLMLLYAVAKRNFGSPWIYLAVVFAAVIVCFVMMLAADDYRLNRLMVALNPQSDPMGMGFIQVQIREALGHLGAFNGYPDFIIKEFRGDELWLIQAAAEKGFAVFGIAVAEAALCIWTWIFAVKKQKSHLAKAVISSVFFTFLILIADGIAANTGYWITGQTFLPFMTGGKGSFAVCGLMMGCAASAVRNGELFTVRKAEKRQMSERLPFIEFEDNRIIINLR